MNIRRRACLTLPGALLLPLPTLAKAAAADPFGTPQWPDLQREFFGAGRLQFDARVKVQGPDFAEDPMQVPISVSADGMGSVEQIRVIVDRNPIRQVLDFFPGPQGGVLPRLSFRFKLEQASPVRAAVRTRDGLWHVGGLFVDSAGGGCTVAGLARRDGSWSRTLGEVSGRLFTGIALREGTSRLRLRVMHPMDTGLVSGIPAFHIRQLRLHDATGRELARLQAFEPLSENPVFSFDFAAAPAGPLRLSGSDNNGNRIEGLIA